MRGIRSLSTERILLIVLLVLTAATIPFVKPLFIDGHIEVTGTVFEWTNPPSGQSTLVLWSENLPEGVEVVPLAGAAVTVFHARDHAKEAIDESKNWRNDAVTDQSGSFSTSSTTNPSPHHPVLRVRHKGFQSLEVIFLHPDAERTGPESNSSRTATVLMVQSP
jgi:hypothetical protein